MSCIQAAVFNLPDVCALLCRYVLRLLGEQQRSN